MEKLLNQDGITCGRLEAGDWAIYRDMQLAWRRDEGASLEAEEQFTQQRWEEQLRSMGTVFVLMKDDQPIGYIRIQSPEFNDPHQELTSLHILKEHRGQHLPDLLIKAALYYLADRTNDDLCVANVSPKGRSNKEAFRVAERNGFQYEGIKYPYGDNDDDPYHHFEFNLQNMRYAPEG